MNYTLGDVTLHVQERGTGEPALLFLHYWGGTSRTWNRVIAGLQDHFRCISYDQRGWGQSSKPAGGYDLASLANDAAALIDALQLRRYVLVGHSMGGKIAQLLASRRPVGLAGLILVAPAPPTPVRFPEEALQQQLHAYDNRETAEGAARFLTARTPAPDTLEQIIQDSLSGSPEAKRTWPTATILEDITSAVTLINVPTLVLAGEKDPIDSIEQHRSEVLPRIAGATLEVVTGSGHLSPIDEPEQLATAIRRFATKLSAAGDPRE